MKHGLGIDAGGTASRWCVATEAGDVLASGEALGMTALAIGTEGGRAHLRATLGAIAETARAHQPALAVVGITGYGGEGGEGGEDDLVALLEGALGMPVSLRSDVEIAYLDTFAPGEGHLVYAGTGSIGAYVDAEGRFARIGGHGGLVDDAGGGYWIAIRALRHVWRMLDEDPKYDSPLARALFARIGGTDWASTRRFVYEGGFEANRGRIGTLAVAVAAADDPAARAILEDAGRELARIAHLMTRHFGGPIPIALGGGVFSLSPIIEATLRGELPGRAIRRVPESGPHRAAARIAARDA
jgi:glucosamine kinase